MKLEVPLPFIQIFFQDKKKNISTLHPSGIKYYGSYTYLASCALRKEALQVLYKISTN